VKGSAETLKERENLHAGGDPDATAFMAYQRKMGSRRSRSSHIVRALEMHMAFLCFDSGQTSLFVL
jgi:hypothetical protein